MDGETSYTPVYPLHFPLLSVLPTASGDRRQIPLVLSCLFCRSSSGLRRNDPQDESPPPDLLMGHLKHQKSRCLGGFPAPGEQVIRPWGATHEVGDSGLRLPTAGLPVEFHQVQRGGGWGQRPVRGGVAHVLPQERGAQPERGPPTGIHCPPSAPPVERQEPW